MCGVRWEPRQQQYPVISTPVILPRRKISIDNQRLASRHKTLAIRNAIPKMQLQLVSVKSADNLYVQVPMKPYPAVVTCVLVLVVKGVTRIL
jgi:hypothetical protein